MNNFTILIQGPIHNNGLSYIDSYRQYCDIFISTWNCEDINRIKHYSYTSCDLPKVQCFNRGNIYYQALSTYNGLKFINTEYVIKLRFDEYFSNLKPIFDSVIKYPNRITCINAFISKFYTLNMSDHIIAGKTSVLKDTFETVLELCNRLNNTEEIPNGDIFDLDVEKAITETIIFTSFLKTIGVKPESSKDIELKNKHLNVIDCESLGNFMVVCNNNKLLLTKGKQVAAWSDGVRTNEDFK